MKTILMTILGTAAISVFAQEATSDEWMRQAKSERSAAEVRAEAMRMRASGELASLADPGFLPAVAAPRARTAVIDDLLRARANRELAAIGAEAHDFAAAPPTKVYASRETFASAR